MMVSALIYARYYMFHFIQEGWTALIRAAENGHLEVVRLLLQAGADKEKTTKVRDLSNDRIFSHLCTLLYVSIPLECSDSPHVGSSVWTPGGGAAPAAGRG